MVGTHSSQYKLSSDGTDTESDANEGVEAKDFYADQSVDDSKKNMVMTQQTLDFTTGTLVIGPVLDSDNPRAITHIKTFKAMPSNYILQKFGTGILAHTPRLGDKENPPCAVFSEKVEAVVRSFQEVHVDYPWSWRTNPTITKMLADNEHYTAICGFVTAHLWSFYCSSQNRLSLDLTMGAPQISKSDKHPLRYTANLFALTTIPLPYTANRFALM